MSDNNMDTVEAVTRRLAEIQGALHDLPDDAFSERYELRKEQDELRLKAKSFADELEKSRSTEDLLAELSGLRTKMRGIEDQRIDLVMQAGSGGSSSSEMGNLGGVQLNKGIDDAMGLPQVKARIGVIKGILADRGVEVPPAD